MTAGLARVLEPIFRDEVAQLRGHLDEEFLTAAGWDPGQLECGVAILVLFDVAGRASAKWWVDRYDLR